MSPLTTRDRRLIRRETAWAWACLTLAAVLLVYGLVVRGDGVVQARELWSQRAMEATCAGLLPRLGLGLFRLQRIARR